MSKILPSYKKALIDELTASISSNVSNYYAIAANPISVDTLTEVANTVYATQFNPNWTALFGKKITAGDIVPVVDKNIWTTNTVYNRYDNTVANLTNYYVISANSFAGGDLYVYKCIDNANGAASTVDPKTIGTPTQATTFQTVDNYKWRYVAKIPSRSYVDFSSSYFAPIYPDYLTVSTAATYSGVEVVVLTNGGNGYTSYTSGYVVSAPNSTVIQISDNASIDADYYTKNGIYLYNTTSATSQLFTVAQYVSSSGNNFVYLDSPANTALISNSTTQYIISPKVVFNTDGESQPKAYSVINTTSNSISSIVMLDIGSNISRADVTIQSNGSFGSGASAYAIVPPPGGHGSEPASELNVKGMAIRFNFANNEVGNVVTSNVVYNKVAIVKNPHFMYANGAKSSTRYSANAFNCVLKANVSPSYTSSVGVSVSGANSGAKATVVFSNSTNIYLVGDQTFQTGEGLLNASGNYTTNLTTISAISNVYTKDLKPIYVKNINNVNRLDSQTETFKIIIEI